MSEIRGYIAIVTGKDGKTEKVIHDLYDRHISREQFVSEALAAVVKKHGADWVATYTVKEF